MFHAVNGIEYWAAQKVNGMSYGGMALHFMDSKEFINKYGSAINSLYQIFLGREADKTGYEFWSKAYENGASLKDVATQFIGSIEFVGSKGIDVNGWDFSI